MAEVIENLYVEENEVYVEENGVCVEENEVIHGRK